MCRPWKWTGEIKSVEVYTDFLALPDRTYESGKLHPGVLLFGDMNGDGKLDEEDKNIIIDNINEAEKSGGGQTGRKFPR